MTSLPALQFPGPTGEIVAERVDADGTRVLVMLPDLDTLLGTIGFSRSDAIVLPGHARPIDGWSIFGALREQLARRVH